MASLLRRLFVWMFPLRVGVSIVTSDGKITRLKDSVRLLPVWNFHTEQVQFYHRDFEFSLYELGDPIPATDIVAVLYWLPLWRFGLSRGGEKAVQCTLTLAMPIDVENRGTTATIHYGYRPAFSW